MLSRVFGVYRIGAEHTISEQERNIKTGADIIYSIGEFMTVFSKTVAERTRPGQRQDVEEQGTPPCHLSFSLPVEHH